MSSSQQNHLELIISNYVRNNYDNKFNDKYIPIPLKCIIIKFSNKIIPCSIMSISEDLTFYQSLKTKLPNIKNLQLLFKGSDHDFSAKQFHSLCDNKGPTITIIESEYGNIFGGYTSKSWNTNFTFVKDENAFVFLIKSDDESLLNKCPIICEVKGQNIDYAVAHNPTAGPLFGIKDIWIHDDCHKSDRNISGGLSNYGAFQCDTINISGGDGVKFKVVEYEVFQAL